MTETPGLPEEPDEGQDDLDDDELNEDPYDDELQDILAQADPNFELSQEDQEGVGDE